MRIFTPKVELPFAGHPTLGTAFVLAAPLQLGVIRLETGVGVVPVELTRDESGRIVFGRMTQPVPTVAPFEREAELLAALGVERRSCRSRSTTTASSTSTSGCGRGGRRRARSGSAGARARSTWSA